MIKKEDIWRCSNFEVSEVVMNHILNISKIYEFFIYKEVAEELKKERIFYARYNNNSIFLIEISRERVLRN